MKLGLAYFGDLSKEKVDLQKQMGLKYAIANANTVKEYPSHSYENLALLKKSFEQNGIKLSVIEGPTPLDKVKLGLPGAEEELDNFKEFLRGCAKLDIRTICYNWMPVIGWFRTRTGMVDRGGALVTGFDFEDVKDAPFTQAGKVSQESLWKNLEAFLKEVVPLCEELNVDLALHPDDPPVPELKGMGRILISAEAFDRVFSLYDSPHNAMTFCQGCFSTMGEDVVSAIHHFGDKIKFVHFRDVQGDRWKFNETFHDDGKTDMYEAMKAYYEIGFSGIARPDHVPTLVGEDNSKPSYGLLGNLFAVGYIKGLMEAVEKEKGIWTGSFR